MNFLQVCFRSNHFVFNLQSSCPLSNEILSSRCKVPSVMFHFTILPSGSNFNWKILQLRCLESKHFPKVTYCVLGLFPPMHIFPVTKFVNVFAKPQYLCVATFKIKKIFCHKFPLLWKTISIKLKFSTATNTTQHYCISSSSLGLFTPSLGSLCFEH